MLYHESTGFPVKINLPKMIKLWYSKHAQRAAITDRYGAIGLQNDWEHSNGRIIEMETDTRGNPVKLVIRASYDSFHDICVVISLEAPVHDRLVVKTVWLNLKTDNHATLNENVYKRA